MHQQSLGNRSIKGPRLGLEERYAPVEGTSGSLALDLFYDLDQHDPRGPPPPGADMAACEASPTSVTGRRAARASSQCRASPQAT